MQRKQIVRRIGVPAAALLVGALALAVQPSPGGARSGSAEVVRLKDARLKFEVNGTDRDGGVQVFVDADAWTTMSIFDPRGTRILTATAGGRMAKQGGTELFLESAEPPFDELPLEQLLRRWPAGIYTFRGVGPSGEHLVGSAGLTHRIPAAPRLVSPLEDDGPQDPSRTVVRWRPAPRQAGGPIIGYQVIVVRPDTGLKALPKVTLDVTMPPTARELAIPPGFLRPGAEYEWEVLAIERSGNQTISSGAFTTAG